MIDFPAASLLLVRLVFGLTFAAHGAQKLFGFFGGHGVQGTAKIFESLGIKPGKPMVVLAGSSELGGGLLFAMGLLTPLSAAAIVGTMLVAVFKVTGKNGYWITSNGSEYSVAIIAVAIAVALSGPGAYSLDFMIFR